MAVDHQDTNTRKSIAAIQKIWNNPLQIIVAEAVFFDA